MSFEDEKRRHLRRLREAREAGWADEGAMPLVDAVNAHPDYATTSSCAGRVQVLSLPEAGDKPGSTVLGKWHRPASVAEVRGALERADGGADGETVVLFGEPPILHAVARDLAAAVALRNAADAAGFRHSNIRSIRLGAGSPPVVKKTVVEVAAGGRVEAPVARGAVRPGPDYLDLLVEAAGDVVRTGQSRLPGLIDAVHELPALPDR